jgi:hypothetical protein
LELLAQELRPKRPITAAPKTAAKSDFERFICLLVFKDGTKLQHFLHIRKYHVHFLRIFLKIGTFAWQNRIKKESSPPNDGDDLA